MFQELHVSLNTAHNSSQESLAHAFAVFHDPFPLRFSSGEAIGCGRYISTLPCPSA